MTTSIAVQSFLSAWHKTVERKDLKEISDFVVDNVRLLSPALYQPKIGKREVIALLEDVLASIENYTITKTWIDGNEIIIEFEAIVEGRSIQGIDRIILNKDGKMTELKVFIRPFSGLKALMMSVVKRQIERMQGVKGLIAKITFAIKARGQMK